MAVICPNCSTENSDTAKFCSECATPLAGVAAAPTREVRKTVTVVFCDVTGSTAMGEKLDPESLRRVMQRYFAAMQGALEKHGGTVEKFIGDAVMAVFGIPLLREDDALRAVRAASEMRLARDELNKELLEEWDVQIQARIGVNTGEVVAGDASQRQTFATGDTVNVAARLEQAAPPGEIYIGVETYKLVKDAVKVEPVDPLTLKGKSEGVPAFRLIEVIEGAEGTARRLSSPLVGRTRELDLLKQAFERSVSERTCHMFTILGQAGAGKSRLVRELLAHVQDQALDLAGRCQSYGVNVTYWPLKEIVRDVAKLDEDDTADEVQTKLVALLEGEDQALLVADRVAQAIDVVEATATPEEVFWAVRKLLEALARKQPVVVVFDDIHWAEPTFLDLIDHIADWARDAPILLLCMSRPDLLDQRPAWGGGKLNATSLLLEPLSSEDCAIIINNLLGQSELARNLRTRIIQVAEGNPLYLEQVLAMLIDDELLRKDNGRWIPTQDLSDITVPPTIQALLTARLDKLQGEERQVVERASVIGKVFYRGAVAELSPEAERPAVSSNLLTLVRKEFIRPDKSTFAGDDAFRFRNVVIRDAAYESISKEIRADMHERFAVWLERVARDRVGEYDEILGYHYEQAHLFRTQLGPLDPRAKELARLASTKLASAGRKALHRTDLPAAVGLLQRAAQILPPDDADRVLLLPDLGRALLQTGDLTRADEVLKEAITAAEATGDRLLSAQAQLIHFQVQLFSAGMSTGEAQVEVEKLIPIFQELGDDLGQARAWRLLALIHWTRANELPTQDALEMALQHARRAADKAEETEILSWLVPSIFGPYSATDAIGMCKKILEQTDSKRVESTILHTRAAFEAMNGKFDLARELIARGRALYEDLGLKLSIAEKTSMIRGFVEFLAGDPAAAERALAEGYSMLEGMGETIYSATLASDLARAHYQQGRYDEAARFIAICEENADPDDVESQVATRSMRAKLAARDGNLEDAENLAREAVTFSQKTDFLGMQADALMDLAEVLQLAGRADESRTAIEEAIALYRKKGNEVAADRAQAALAA
ncbi:MAG TPA: adenylate/guanylate cyclase domain-containing protein [Actinomycetota bacterium]|nr:adenylate/guanylate cyclase domain-containing protein [Actinomycetota bacterium]